ncbi:FAD linked oxidase, partial [Chytriomyces sp. MP71]
HFDGTAGILTAQAGCVLEVLDNWLSERGFVMPLDLGAKGTCQIGGNVATNAGGLRLLRYGSLHGTVLSMEVVKADGTIMNLGQPLRKDNTGYDLKHLFIGSEGTLGVITNVSILTPRKPTAVNVAVLALPDFSSVQKAFSLARSHLTEILSAFEFWDAPCAHLVHTHITHTRPLFDTLHPFHVLVETSGSSPEHDAAKVAAYLDALFEQGVAVDGVQAESETQRAGMWAFRESIPEACARDGKGGNLKYDISVPVERIYDIIPAMRARLEERGLYDPVESAGALREGRVVGFGHFGDGNLHLNITGAAWDKAVEDAVEPFVYEWVQQHQGSISAEHGLGVMKAPYIGYSKSPEAIAAMHEVKKMW